MNRLASIFNILMFCFSIANASFENTETGIFVLNRNDFSEQIFFHLHCLLISGTVKPAEDKTNTVSKSTVYDISNACKDPEIVRAKTGSREINDVVIHGNLKEFEPLMRRLLVCISNGAHRYRRSIDENVLAYCDRLIAPSEKTDESPLPNTPTDDEEIEDQEKSVFSS